MKTAAKKRPERERVRILGRGLRAQRGVHLTLRALREAVGKTQAELAEAAGIDQADVSRLESRDRFDDCQFSTLQRYVGALGGTLGLVAQFGDKKFAIVGVAPGPAAKSVVPKSPRSRRT